MAGESYVFRGSGAERRHWTRGTSAPHSGEAEATALSPSPMPLVRGPARCASFGAPKPNFSTRAVNRITTPTSPILSQLRHRIRSMVLATLLTGPSRAGAKTSGGRGPVGDRLRRSGYHAIDARRPGAVWECEKSHPSRSGTHRGRRPAARSAKVGTAIFPCGISRPRELVTSASPDRGWIVVADRRDQPHADHGETEMDGPKVQAASQNTHSRRSHGIRRIRIVEMTSRLGSLLPFRQRPSEPADQCSVCRATAVDGVLRGDGDEITCLGCAILQSLGLGEWRPVSRVVTSQLPIPA